MAMIALRQLLDHAAEHDYGVPAFNINNMEQGLAILKAAAAVDAPVILQASRGARSYAELPAEAVKYVRRIEELVEAPIVLLSTSPERDDTIMMRDPFAG